ncbi:MAG: sialate O-acetylesterase [Planctomycetes bacterium]|nr:sialate O-acetylesterase [Planctomycetota bacterium]
MRSWKSRVALQTALLALAAVAHAGQAGRSPVKVFLLAGQSNMEGQAVVDLDHPRDYNGGKGTLVDVMRDPAKAPLFAHLKDKDGKWAVRGDVWVWYKTASGLKKGNLSIGYAVYPGKHHFGPELQCGHVLGNALDSQVLLVKTA